MTQEPLKSLMLDSTNKSSFALLSSLARLGAQENMRIDRKLFEGFAASDLPILRIYRWKPSFTYGVSQKSENLQSFENLKQFGDNHAARMTGGGILFHGNDISYSLVIPTAYVKNLSVKESYEVICSFLLEFYKALGLDPVYAKERGDVTLCYSVYCQEGFEPYDILIDGKKVGGNAQRRSKEMIFQHGSISIDNAGYGMGHSLEDLGISISFKEAQELLVKSFAQCFNVQFKQINEDVLHAS